MKRLRESFRGDERGAVALIFGLSVFMVVFCVGLAIDGGRAYSVAARVASALDAAALAAAKLLDKEGVSDSEIAAQAQAYFNAHTVNVPVPGTVFRNLTVIPNRGDSSVTVKVDISMPTTFAQLAHVNTFDFPKESTVVYEIKRVELAMVLDVTGSMNSNGRLDAMKAAAKSVVDTIIDPSAPELTRISLVPYSAAVNVGSYADQASGGDSLDGCVMERLFPPNRDTDSPPGFPNNFAVNGQLNSGTNSRYDCPDAVLLPLTGDTATLKSTIDSYAASGWTAGHIGLAWGWNTISDRWAGVFTGTAEPREYNPSRNIKAILLMTDGDFNTAYTEGTTEAAQIAESTARTHALCDAIKAKGVRIFAVAFQAPPAAESLMQSCASAGDYFDAGNSAQLQSAFQTVAQSLLQLRIKS